jgi:5'-nucleotidase
MMNDIPAWSVAGKPTDAVIIGLYALNLNPSIVVSGINIGENLSYESINVRTVGVHWKPPTRGQRALHFRSRLRIRGINLMTPVTTDKTLPQQKVLFVTS